MRSLKNKNFKKERRKENEEKEYQQKEAVEDENPLKDSLPPIISNHHSTTHSSFNSSSESINNNNTHNNNNINNNNTINNYNHNNISNKNSNNNNNYNNNNINNNNNNNNNSDSINNNSISSTEDSFQPNPSNNIINNNNNHHPNNNLNNHHNNNNNNNNSNNNNNNNNTNNISIDHFDASPNNNNNNQNSNNNNSNNQNNNQNNSNGNNQSNNQNKNNINNEKEKEEGEAFTNGEEVIEKAVKTKIKIVGLGLTSLEYTYLIGYLPLRLLENEFIYFDENRMRVSSIYLLISCFVIFWLKLLNKKFRKLYLCFQLMGKWSQIRKNKAQETLERNKKNNSPKNVQDISFPEFHLGENYGAGCIVSYDGNYYLADHFNNCGVPSSTTSPFFFFLFKEPSLIHDFVLLLQFVVVSVQLFELVLLSPKHYLFWAPQFFLLFLNYLLLYFCLCLRHNNLSSLKKFSFFK